MHGAVKSSQVNRTREAAKQAHPPRTHHTYANKRKMPPRLATAATTLALLLAFVALVAAPVAAHGLRSSSSSSSSSSAPAPVSSAAAAKEAQTTTTTTTTTETAPAASGAAHAHTARRAQPQQQEQEDEVVEVELDAAARLPGGADQDEGKQQRQEGLAMAMATLRDAVVAGLRGGGGRKLLLEHFRTEQDVSEVIRCLVTPGDGWSESGATGHHRCKIGIAFFSVLFVYGIASFPIWGPMALGKEAVQLLQESGWPSFLDSTMMERADATLGYSSGPRFFPESEINPGNKEASPSSSPISDEREEEEYQRLVQEAQHATEIAMGAIQRLATAAARRLGKRG